MSAVRASVPPADLSDTEFLPYPATSRTATIADGNDIERCSAHPILLTPELEAFSLSGFAKT